jgi:hypothetical protein
MGGGEVPVELDQNAPVFVAVDLHEEK